MTQNSESSYSDNDEGGGGVGDVVLGEEPVAVGVLTISTIDP